MTERRRSDVPRTALGFPPRGEHFEYHPTEGYQISVPNGYRWDWAHDRLVTVPAGDLMSRRREFNPNSDKPVCQGGPRWYV